MDAVRQTFDDICAKVASNFWNKDLNNVDWKQVQSSYRKKLDALPRQKQNGGVCCPIEFQSLVNEMLSHLKASHTLYVIEDDVEFATLSSVKKQDIQGQPVDHIGALGRRVGTSYVVLSVLEDGPASRAGLKAGDIITGVSTTSSTKPAPTATTKFRSGGSFRALAGQQVTLHVNRPSSKKATTSLKVPITPIRQNMLRSMLEAMSRSVKIFQDPVLTRNKKIGYVHLWTTSHDAFKQLLETIVLEELQHTDGLILDLRDGYGGHPWGYGDIFFRPEIQWESDRRQMPSVTRKITAYGKPLVVLINEGTRSAKEYLGYQFKVSGRAILVGATTCGAFLEADMFPVADSAVKGLLLLPVGGLKLDGKQIEKVGVEPDVKVATQPNVSYTEQDPQIAAGLRAMKDAMSSGHVFL